MPVILKDEQEKPDATQILATNKTVNDFSEETLSHKYYHTFPFRLRVGTQPLSQKYI